MAPEQAEHTKHANIAGVGLVYDAVVAGGGG
jgi:hypothetical protein